MSQRKPMGAFWAILAVPDHILSGRRAVLLGRMFLLDNGSRGCTANAGTLGQYTGLSERSVEKYRGELHELGLVYRVTGTRGWHVNLPNGFPPDRATDAQILAYTRRMIDMISGESTPSVAPKVRLPGNEVPQPGSESTPVGVAKYAQHRTDTEAESTPAGVGNVLATITTPTAGLMSTQETHDISTHECNTSHLTATHENSNGKGVSQEHDGKPSVREVIDRLGAGMTPPKGETFEERKARCRAMARGNR